MCIGKWIKTMLGWDALLGRVQDAEWDIAGLESELLKLREEVFPPPPPTPEYFDPKVEPYPSEIAGLKVGYVVVGVDTPLRVADKDNVLLPYENPEWADNTMGQRVQVKAGRVLAVYALGDQFAYGDPRPYIFDGGTVAYRVMDEQIVDGKELWAFDHPHFYIMYRFTTEQWIP